MTRYRLQFQSNLRAAPSEVWAWITSLEGISAETAPLFRMSAPAGISRLQDVDVVPGRPLFRSRIYLAGFLPVDYSDLTLLALEEGKGFVEQSPMGSMRLWRHERRIEPGPGGQGSVLTDTLTFEPRYAHALVAWFIKRVFVHRHRVLQQKMGQAAAPTKKG